MKKSETRVRDHNFNRYIGLYNIYYFYKYGVRFYRGDLWGIGILGRIIREPARNREEFIEIVKKDLMKKSVTKKLLKR